MKKLIFLIMVMVMIMVFISPALAQGAVKIAFIGPITGTAADMGLGGRNSFLLAVREANESELFPFKIETMVLDDGGDPAVALTAAMKAVADNNVVAIVAHWNSACALATVHTYHKAGIPTVIWGAIHPDITYGNDYREITRVCQVAKVQDYFLVRFLIDLGYKSYSVIHDKTSYGEAHANSFIEAVNEFGGQILSRDGTTEGERDFSPVLTMIRPRNPEVVFYAGYHTEAAFIKMQMKELDMDQLLVGITGMSAETFNELAGEYAEGSMHAREGIPLAELPGGRKFVAAYEDANFAEPYEAYGPFAYEATNVVLTALKKVGADRGKLIDEIAVTKDFDLIFGGWSFDEHGQTDLELYRAYVSQDGKWVVWEESEYATGKRLLPVIGHVKP
ncbi:branched-chain amino acid ABC transporter substrate-binding protein [Candidatus Atribacteria bacterium 1244-E10-H5-B2]|nr:MAG: branched-chain amino acid ABC transporter substrate-binding protein [Candidatus Atribacteria bacterium 1244-E10-H5-B2]